MLCPAPFSWAVSPRPHVQVVQHHGGTCGSPPSCAGSWVLLDLTTLETLPLYSSWLSSSRPCNSNCLKSLLPSLSSNTRLYSGTT